MKSYQRREQQAYPYYKVATWDARSLTWRDGKKAFATADEAMRSFPRGAAGKYRLSEVTENSRRDLEVFEVI